MTARHSPSAHFSMVRSFHLADVVTLLNAALGTAAILTALTYVKTGEVWRFLASGVLLVGALIADFADGAVARKRGTATSSPLGRELDSLADIISFGVAPAVMGFVAGLSSALDSLLLVWLVACGVSRLARYNVTAAGLSGPTGKVRFYEGTPITFSLLLVAVLLGSVLTGHYGSAILGGVWGSGALAFHPLSLMYLVSGCAMISKTLRIPKP